MAHEISTCRTSSPRKQHYRESGGPKPAPGSKKGSNPPKPCALVPAFETVIQPQSRAPSCPYPSFPRKRETRDFSRLPLGPGVRGDDLQHRLVLACAGPTWLSSLSARMMF